MLVMVLCLASVRLVGVLLLRLRSVARGGIDHEMETLLGSREFRNIIFGVRSANVLLHRAITFLLALQARLATIFFTSVLVTEWLIAPE